MSAARRALWRDAQALSSAAGAELAPRFRRAAVRRDPALSLFDLDPPPDWAGEPPAARARLARLTGAVLVSRSWSRAISGAVLGRAAEALGDEALEEIINLPDIVAPEAHDPAAASGDASALDRLGACALLTAAEADGARRARLARLFPAGAGGVVAPAAAATAQHTAESLRRAVDAAEDAA